MDIALAWAIYLEGKKDREKFKEMDWDLRTWDQWNFNECDELFGDDWPGRIPAQLVAHTLYFFSKKGDLAMDPMAGDIRSPIRLLLMRLIRMIML